MNFVKDEGGQGAAEYILLFGGVIVIAIAALVIYRAYFDNTSLNAANDIGSERANLTNITNNTTGKVPITPKPLPPKPAPIF